MIGCDVTRVQGEHDVDGAVRLELVDIARAERHAVGEADAFGGSATRVDQVGPAIEPEQRGCVAEHVPQAPRYVNVRQPRSLNWCRNWLHRAHTP